MVGGEGDQIVVDVNVILTKLVSGVPLAVGVMDAGDVTALHIVPRRDSRAKEGYQREISKARVSKLASDLETGEVDLPTSVLLNLRDYEPDRHLPDGKVLRLSDEDRLYVVDGQHRLGSLEKLIEKDEKRWSKFPLPITCMLGVSEAEEMKQFYVVNSTAKSVRTDLALELLRERAEVEPGLWGKLEEQGQTWKVVAQRLTDTLGEDSPIWQNRIRRPSDPMGTTTVRSSGMVTSLKPALSSSYFSQLSPEQQFEVLDAFWSGVKLVMPTAFDDPQRYVIQKALGVVVMHLVLLTVIEVMRSRGRSLKEPEDYADTLRKALLTLEGSTANDEMARGAGFWLSGPNGAAGTFSSSAGKRVLTSKIKHGLPEMVLE